MKRTRTFLLSALAFALNFSGLLAQNNALTFNGVDNYVSCSNIAVGGDQSFTYAAWINCANPEAGHWQGIVYHGFGAESQGHMGIDPYGYLSGGTGNSNTTDWETHVSAYKIPANTWVFVSMVLNRDAETVSFYANGILVETDGHSAAPLTTSDPLTIALGAGSEYFSGKIDEVRIWSTARSQNQLRINMYRELPDPASENDLIAYYKFNETSGTTLTDTKGNYNGTLTNMAGNEWTPSPAFSGPKNCLNFDGANDYVSIPDADALDLTNNYTIEAWIFPTAFSSLAGIVSKYQNPASYGFTLRLTYDAPYSGISFDEMWTDPGVITTNEWQHIAAVNNAGTRHLYINGAEVPLLYGTGNAAANTDPVTIGSDYTFGGGRFFSGRIDEVRIWGTARSVTEIRDNMCHSITGQEAGLLAYYTFDNSSGTTTLQDLSGNNHDGTLTNMDAATGWVSSAAYNTWLNVNPTYAWFNEPAYWSRGTVPGSSDNTGIYPTGGKTPLLMYNATLQFNNLIIGTGATLSYNDTPTGSISAYGNYFNNGTFNFSNRLLNFQGSKSKFYLGGTSEISCTGLGLGSNHNVIITPDGKLTLSMGVSVSTGSTLTIQSNCSSTGSLINGSVGLSSIQIQRFISGFDAYSPETRANHGWHFLSSPVSDQAISAFHTAGSGDDFYKWDEAADIWINRTADGGTLNPEFETNFTVGSAYLIANSATSTKTFTGALNNSDLTFSDLSNTSGSVYSGWHLIGNPFPCALNCTNFTRVGVDYNFQIWDEENASYSVISDADQIIPPMNGFMMHVQYDGDNTLTIHKSDRVHAGGTFYKSTQAFTNGFKLTAVDPEGKTAQPTLIRFNPDATGSYDGFYDSYFLSGFAPQFFSVSNNEAYALNTLPQLTEDVQIPLSFIKNKSGQFYIKAEGLENLNTSDPVFLTDKIARITHNLSENPVYAFTAFPGDSPERFLLHFKPLSTNNVNSSNRFLPAWYAQGRLHISGENGEGELRIFNSAGQLIYQQRVNLTIDFSVPVSLQNHAFCVVEWIGKESVRSAKISVNNQ